MKLNDIQNKLLSEYIDNYFIPKLAHLISLSSTEESKLTDLEDIRLAATLMFKDCCDKFIPLLKGDKKERNQQKIVTLVTLNGIINSNKEATELKFISSICDRRLSVVPSAMNSSEWLETQHQLIGQTVKARILTWLTEHENPLQEYNYRTSQMLR